MTYRIAYSKRALAQLEALYLYIADAAGPERAMVFVSSITDYCEGLETFALRGTMREISGRGCDCWAFGGASRLH